MNLENMSTIDLKCILQERVKFHKAVKRVYNVDDKFYQESSKRLNEVVVVLKSRKAL